MKRIITYLIFIATILAFIIKTHHFNWLLPVGIVSAIGLLLIVFYTIGEEVKINAEIDRQIEEEERIKREKNMPKLEPIEYIDGTSTPAKAWQNLKDMDELYRGLRKYVNVEGGSSMFYLVSFSGTKYFVCYDQDVHQYAISHIDQDDDLSRFAKAEMSYGYTNFKYDKDTNTLIVY